MTHSLPPPQRNVLGRMGMMSPGLFPYRDDHQPMTNSDGLGLYKVGLNSMSQFLVQSYLWGQLQDSWDWTLAQIHQPPLTCLPHPIFSQEHSLNKSNVLKSCPRLCLEGTQPK